MKKFLTDMHTHSKYSHDGQASLDEMLATAQKLGVDFYGTSEHFDYDYDLTKLPKEELARITNSSPEEYFHGARHLQEDYEGCMNVAVGAEFGYSDDEAVQGRYAQTYEKYRPDYVINSVHGWKGEDFARYDFGGTSKTELYRNYLRLVRRSLDAPYPYDIVGHIGYIMRYVSFEDRLIMLEEFGEEIDDILRAIIQKGKILEVNTATKMLPVRSLPDEAIVRRYYELGGRQISYGSDAHFPERIMDKRDDVVEMLKTIGFTHITLPFRGEYIKVEL
ncbi:MAG: histidinol-phosphatase HisJ family protein [Clostridia bacterium]|nr:histidinol-phosphatase HisJ family protein [Clostridia bacterium]